MGAPAAALLYFRRLRGSGNDLPSELEESLLDSWRRPGAGVAEGRLLASGGLASACQDISDGFTATLEQLTAASGGIGCEVDEKALPIAPAADAVAKIGDLDRLSLALGASVDFELVFALPPEQAERCRAAFADHDFELHIVGEFKSEAGLTVRRSDGRMSALPGSGWTHQSDDPLSSLVTYKDNQE